MTNKSRQNQWPGMTDITAAGERISRLTTSTPLTTLMINQQPVICKREYMQVTGSFKLRGAANAVASLPGAAERLVTASAGNHGLGVVYAGGKHKKRVIVFVAEGARKAKIEKMRELGAEVRIAGADYDAAEELAMDFAREEDLPFVHAFDDLPVIAGQGTVALELLEQSEAWDTLLIPVGGGGLIAGCAIAAKDRRPGVRIFGVQPKASDPMKAALEAGEVVERPIGETVCDALAGRFVTERTREITSELVEEVLTIGESSVLAALALVEEQLGDRIEPSAVAGLAAIMEHGGEIGGKWATILTGGNIDSSDYESLFGTL
jgi:threonine dehydratase